MSEEEKWDILYRLEVALEMIDLGYVLGPLQAWYDEQEEVDPDSFWRQQADVLIGSPSIPDQYEIFYSPEPDWQEAAKII